MKKLLCIPVMLLLALVFTTSMAMADKGVGIVVLNKTEYPLWVKVVIKSEGHSKSIDKTAEKGGMVIFRDSETAHAAGAKNPSWVAEVGLSSFRIEPGKTQCTLTPNQEEYMLVERQGPCSFQFYVAN
jgi:hypothetical protein